MPSFMSVPTTDRGEPASRMDGRSSIQNFTVTKHVYVTWSQLQPPVGFPSDKRQTHKHFNDCRCICRTLLKELFIQRRKDGIDFSSIRKLESKKKKRKRNVLNAALLDLTSLGRYILNRASSAFFWEL